MKVFQKFANLTRKTKTLLFLMIFLNTFDAGMTSYLITTNLGYEANPLMALLLAQGVEWFLLVKVVFVNYIIWHLANLANEPKNKIANYGIAIVTVAYSLLFFYYLFGFIFVLPGVI